MKKSFIIAGLAGLTALTAVSSAQAEERWPRWYIGLSGGYTYMADQDVSGGGIGANSISLNDGYGIGGSIGYLPSSSMPLLNAMRFEAEVTYHTNDIHSVHLNNGTNVTGSGTLDSTAYMINALYDLPTGSNWSPYFGGGIGMATVHLSAGSGAGNGGSSDTQFAYQGLAGIGYAPESLPNTQWTVGYRYLATTDAKFSGTSVEYSTHNFEAGLKLRF